MRFQHFYVSPVCSPTRASLMTGRPFFIYLPFNAPHTPLEVPEKYYQVYQRMHLRPEDFPNIGHTIPRTFDPEVTARIYGMVENLDDNIGRLLKKLEELQLAENTVVIFLTDNGPQQARYNAGMLQRKGSTHEGGIRVPLPWRCRENCRLARRARSFAMCGCRKARAGWSVM